MVDLLMIFIFSVFVACTQSTDDIRSQSVPTRKVEAVESAGKKLYTFNCSACHGFDTSVDGPVGPSLKGSSLELITLRVTTGKYPKGYKPKRKTKQMPQFELTTEDIEKIEKYINE